MRARHPWMVAAEQAAGVGAGAPATHPHSVDVAPVATPAATPAHLDAAEHVGGVSFLEVQASCANLKAPQRTTVSQPRSVSPWRVDDMDLQVQSLRQDLLLSCLCSACCMPCVVWSQVGTMHSILFSHSQRHPNPSAYRVQASTSLLHCAQLGGRGSPIRANDSRKMQRCAFTAQLWRLSEDITIPDATEKSRTRRLGESVASGTHCSFTACLHAQRSFTACLHAQEERGTECTNFGMVSKSECARCVADGLQLRRILAMHVRTSFMCPMHAHRESARSCPLPTLLATMSYAPWSNHAFVFRRCC